jgi:hypothetical protein
MEVRAPICLIVLSASIAIGDPGIAVVELFTSQGCSSCPSADRLLSTLRKEANRDGRPVHVLSFHVDYWNSLGWHDPFSREEFTLRQQAYAQVLSSRVYTPQAVVNGTTEFVGSDAGRAREAIQRALARKAPVRIEMEVSWEAAARKARVSARHDGRPGDVVVNLAWVEDGPPVPVKRGENRGRTLSHAHVVREFQTLAPDAEGRVSAVLQPPAGVDPSRASIIAYVQHGTDFRILGAVATKLTP